MDHNESVRKVEPLMLKQADHPRDAATELEALVLLMPSEEISTARTPSGRRLDRLHHRRLHHRA